MQNETRRRDFLKGAALAAGGAVAAACNSTSTSQGEGPAVRTRPAVRWRLASSFPSSLDTLYGAAEMLSERVAELTGGRFEIRVYEGGELVPPLSVLDSTQSGTVQCAHTASYYFTGKHPALAFDAGVPFGMTARQRFAWLYEGGGIETMAPLFARFGVRSFPAGSTGVQMGGWFRRTVDTLEDLKGLKMRIPGLGGEVMQRLGVNALALAGGEIYQALERGTIDATEWVGPHDDEKLGLHRIAKHYYYPGWWEPGGTLSFLVNLEAWEKLPSDYRAAFASAAGESCTRTTARYDHLNPLALDRLLAAGVDLRPFSDEIMRAARDASFALYEEQAAADETYRTIYASWKSARERMNRWFGTAEQAYARLAFE